MSHKKEIGEKEDLHPPSYAENTNSLRRTWTQPSAPPATPEEEPFLKINTSDHKSEQRSVIGWLPGGESHQKYYEPKSYKDEAKPHNDEPKPYNDEMKPNNDEKQYFLGKKTPLHNIEQLNTILNNMQCKIDTIANEMQAKKKTHPNNDTNKLKVRNKPQVTPKQTSNKNHAYLVRMQPQLVVNMPIPVKSIEESLIRPQQSSLAHSSLTKKQTPVIVMQHHLINSMHQMHPLRDSGISVAGIQPHVHPNNDYINKQPRLYKTDPPQANVIQPEGVIQPQVIVIQEAPKSSSRADFVVLSSTTNEDYCCGDSCSELQSCCAGIGVSLDSCCVGIGKCLDSYCNCCSKCCAAECCVDGDCEDNAGGCYCCSGLESCCAEIGEFMDTCCVGIGGCTDGYCYNCGECSTVFCDGVGCEDCADGGYADDYDGYGGDDYDYWGNDGDCGGDGGGDCGGVGDD